MENIRSLLTKQKLKMSKEEHKYLAATGLTFPTCEEELIAYEKMHQDKKYELDENVLDPFKIVADLEKENKPKQKATNVLKTVNIKVMWNYEIYEIGSKDKEKGKADLIEFERLLPPYLHLTVSKNKHTKPFKLEMIKGLTVYKVWR